MNIQSEIRNYILTHDFVMLPGIGAFLADYSKPYFDSEGNIVPSKRSIRFNGELRNDSNVEVLKEFQNTHFHSIDDVQDAYFEFLDSIEKSIEATGKYLWDDFGTLTRGYKSGTYHFFFDKEPEMAPASPIDIPAYKAPEIIEEEPVITAESRLYKERKKESSWFKYFIFALPIFLLFGALFYMIFVKPKAAKTVKDVQAFTLPLEEEMVVDTLYVDPDTLQYAETIKEHIIRIGLYKTSQDADKIATLLAEYGYPSRVRPHGPLFKVFVVAKDENQVKQYIEEIEKITFDKPIYEK